MASKNFFDVVLGEGGKITILSTFGSINMRLIVKLKGRVHGRTGLGRPPSGKVSEALAPRNCVKL